jgi:hypothetical protein
MFRKSSSGREAMSQRPSGAKRGSYSSVSALAISAALVTIAAMVLRGNLCGLRRGAATTLGSLDQDDYRESEVEK